MQRQRSLLALIVVLVIAAITVIAKIPIPLGLDLQGGSQLTIQVKPSEEIKQITPRELEAVERVIEGRINGLGVSEPVVQTVGQDQILVQLPGVSDPQQAERVLGGTAQLEFRQQKPGTETQLQIEQQVRQELLAKQAELRKTGDNAAIQKNQEALKRSDQVILDLGSDVNGLPKKMWERMGIPTMQWYPIQLHMENQQKIIPMGRLHGVTIDIEGASTLVDFEVIEIVDDNNPYLVLLGIDWAIDMNGVINLKKRTISSQRKTLCMVVPSDPAEGPCYTELVHDYEESHDDLDRIYKITTRDQVQINPTADGRISWDYESSYTSDLDEEIKRW